MLMMCWFYCFDFAWFLYYASAPFLFLCAMFALKRGLRNQRKGLRKAAFAMMLAASTKLFLIDPIFLTSGVKRGLCKVAPKLGALGCDVAGRGDHFIRIGGMVLFLIVGYAIYEYYKVCIPDRKPKDTTPEQVHLRFWANFSFWSVLTMIIWQLAPWVGYLTVGCIPKIFLTLTWQQLALANLGLLLVGFWKLESCVWQYKAAQKERAKYMQNTWTPKDTLWMTVFLYLITLGMSYVAHDLMVRTHSVPHGCVAGEARDNMQWNEIDTGNQYIAQ